MSSEPQKPGPQLKNVDPEMESWSAVEGELNKHDHQMVKDYAEDVDNLLVFAGLFSAVLTAFLVESYQMLQEDNEETNKFLLRRISTQLESFTLTPRFANATLFGALPPDDFTPTRAALWINALWFLSLIFSLSAAFFGIRVRQWLREYMQWSAALAHPRENVHLRQIRFTDFQTWRVFGSISIIPGLLELALVLFVSGVVIFLWTIDPTIAIVITIAVSIFLAVASTITILPALLKRCPYKSPTAWAFVLLSSTVPDTIAFARGLWESYKLYQEYPFMLRSSIPPNRWGLLRGAWHNTVYGYNCVRTWCERDFEGGYVRASRMPGYSLDKDLEDTSNIVAINIPAYTGLEGYNAFHFRISEVGWLVQALRWVARSSQSSNVHNHVTRCTRSMHTPLSTPHYEDDRIRYSIRCLAGLYALQQVPFSDFSGTPWGRTTFASFSEGIAPLRSRLRLEVLQKCDITNDTVKFPQPTPHMIYLDRFRTLPIVEDDKAARAVLGMWAHNLQQLLPLALNDPSLHTLVLDTIAVLSHAYQYTQEFPDVIVQCFNFCQDNAPAIPRVFNAHGIKAAIFDLFPRAMMGIVFNETGHIIECSNPANDYGLHSTNSILAFAHSCGDTIDDLDNMRIFAKVVYRWRLVASRESSIEDRVAIIEEMTRFSDAARKLGILNCGYVANIFDSHFLNDPPEELFFVCEGAVLAPFRRLLNSLHSSSELGLLTDNIAWNLPFRRRMADTVPQGVRGDEDRFKAWVWAFCRAEEGFEGGFGCEEVEHVFAILADTVQDCLDTEVAGMYELEV